MVIAGSDKTTRRRAVRRQQESSPPLFGPALRQAREALGLTLSQIQDRTGVRRRDLEALEEDDLTPFSDERAALVAVRRFAETVGLDAGPISQIVQQRLLGVTDSGPGITGVVPVIRPAPVPAIPAPSATVAAAPAPVTAGGPQGHAFTQTAQVPRVGPAPAAQTASHTLPPGLQFDSTDSIPVTVREEAETPPTSALRLIVIWSVVLLVLLGAAGLAIDHWRPGWLAKIHLTSPAPATTHHGHGTGPASKPALATVTTSGSKLADVTIHSPGFQVVVATQSSCWIHVTSPASATPVFAQTVPPGTTKVFTSTNGQLSVEFGASHVLVAVRILGKTIPNFLLAPSAVPYVMNFHSAT